MILVTGSDGMLGSWICARHPKDTTGFTHKELDITDSAQLYETILEIEPDAVINCAGITRNAHWTADEMIDVNALAPHKIAKLCDLVGAKLVQVSTDCVFSGRDGSYVEHSPSDATTLYGQTKYRGEVEYSPHLTVRTSFVGLPDPKGRGLLAWLESNRGGKVSGYKNVLWNGLCVQTLADILVEMAYSRQHGVVHVFGETISKCDLLVLANHIFQFGIMVEHQNEPRSNKTLNSVRKDRHEVSKSLLEQLVEMKAWDQKYREYLLGLIGQEGYD